MKILSVICMCVQCVFPLMAYVFLYALVCTEHACACVYGCIGGTEDSRRYHSAGLMGVTPLFLRQVLSLAGDVQSSQASSS